MRRETREQRDAYEVWLSGELLLFGLLGAALALFVDYPGLRHSYDFPSFRLVLDTAMMLAGGVVAVLAGIRFSVEGRRFDLLLTCGFLLAAASTLLFVIVPVLDGSHSGRPSAWAGIYGGLGSTLLIAVAPFVRDGVAARRRVLWDCVFALLALLTALWIFLGSLGGDLPRLAATLADPDPPALLTIVLSVQALLSLIALIGFGLRFRNRGDDLDRWLASAATLSLFSSLYRVFTPLLSPTSVSIGDFLKLIAYGVLLVGVWRAISQAEFGRAVADERARVAREIHDGLAQYLFALATHASMLEAGRATPEAIAQIKELAVSAQQEARFAVLALSSAGGTAPFDAALRRYVEFLTADGALEVDVEIDQRVHLAPDEQIEVFRIVQEGLANVRKHANAKRAEVLIVHRDGRRIVRVRDDGTGFEPAESGAGQGLKNIRARATSIAGAATIRSLPGRGTTLEVALRA
jgi:signal transduction histidine kinase